MITFYSIIIATITCFADCDKRIISKPQDLEFITYIVLAVFIGITIILIVASILLIVKLKQSKPQYYDAVRSQIRRGSARLRDNLRNSFRRRNGIEESNISRSFRNRSVG